MIKEIIVKPGQCLFDIALQELGSIEGVFDIAGLNEINDITGILATGSIINVETDNIINNSNKIQSSSTAIDTEFKKGIGYWVIGVDFIIS